MLRSLCPFAQLCLNLYFPVILVLVFSLQGLEPHRAVDHAQTSFAQVLGHLENVHQLLCFCAVQKLPQGAEDSRARGAVAARENNRLSGSINTNFLKCSI